MEAVRGSRARLSGSIESAARLSVWIPVVLTIYFIVRALHAPCAVGIVLLGLFVVAKRWLFLTESASSGGVSATGDESTRQILLPWLALGVLAVALAPALRFGWLLGQGEHPTAFLNADESYNFMIAQGLVQGFPPPDLTYMGRVSAYHLGGPMLAEMLHRLGLSTLHLAFYAIWPFVLKIVAAASIFVIIDKLAPTVSTEMKLIGVIATSGAFTIDFFNLLWNVRNVVKTGGISSDTIFGGMPIVTGYTGFIGQELHYAAPLAVTFFLVLLANLHYARGLVMACILFSIFLAKSSVFVPIGAAWGIFSVYYMIRYRDFRYFWGGVIALVLCLWARPYVMESGYAALGFGHGYGFDWLAERGKNLAKPLGATGGITAAMTGLGLLILGTHVYGWASLSQFNRNKGHRAPASALLLLVALSMLLAALFSIFFVFSLYPTAQAGFDAIHAGIKDKLWRPFDTYIYELGKMSIGEARIVVAYGFSLIAISAVLLYLRRPVSRRFQLTAWGAILVSIIISLSQSYQLTFGSVPKSIKPISSSASDALAAIPVHGSVVLTNQCAYDNKVELHLPLMNAAMAAVYGHQFWACNFMFGNNFAANDALDRLRQIDWFWSTEFDNKHFEFVRKTGITHILFDQSVSMGNKNYVLQFQAPWLVEIYRNDEYVVYRVNLDPQ